MRSKLDGPELFLLNGFFPLTGLGATKSGVDCRVFDAITIFATLVFCASCFVVAISGF